MFLPKMRTACEIYKKTNISGKVHTRYAVKKLLFKETLTKEDVTTLEYNSCNSHEIQQPLMPILHIF